MYHIKSSKCRFNCTKNIETPILCFGNHPPSSWCVAIFDDTTQEVCFTKQPIKWHIMSRSKKHENIRPKMECETQLSAVFVAHRNLFLRTSSLKHKWVVCLFFSLFPCVSRCQMSVKLARPPGCRYYCQSHHVMTLVCKSRGILSLHKHLALSAAVTSWNGSWHKVALQAKNTL